MAAQVNIELAVYLLPVAAVLWIALLAIRAEDQDEIRRSRTSSKDGHHDGDSTKLHVASGGNPISRTAES
jgi:hypothetical protein